MVLPLSTMNSQTAKQLDVKQEQFMSLFTRVERLQTKAGVTQRFGESNKAIHQIYGSKLPRDTRLDLVTIHHLTTDRAYVGNAYSYKFSDPEDPDYTLGHMIRAGMFVWNSWKSVLMTC